MRTRARWAAAVAAAALIAPATAGAQVSVGHSGWTWGNPTPQGNTLRALEFVGERGYAAGDFGTLLRTDDGGASWTGIATGIASDLRRIRIVSRDTIVVAGDCTVRRSDDAGASFTRLPWTTSDESCTAKVSSLAFPSGEVGYLLLDDGNVLRSADGGRTWARRTAVPGTRSTPSGQAAPLDVAFTGADAGVAVTSAGQIFRTTDGGGSWTPVHASPRLLTGLHFPTVETGYAVGLGGLFLKTTDGGATWSEQTVAAGTPPLDFAVVRCVDAERCMAVTAKGDQVIRTLDGGQSFSSVSPSTEAVFAAAFPSPVRAVAVGIGGLTVVSNDAGGTWSGVGDKLRGAFAGLRAASRTTAYAFGPNGALARTVDGGRTWGNVGVSTPNAVIDVSFPTDEVGFALDSTGQLLRTDNAGVSWAILNTGTSTAPRAVLALDSKVVLLIGPRGLRRSTNGGTEFRPVRDRLVRRASLDAADRVPGAVIAYDRGGKAIVVSRDGGRRWRRIPRRPTRSNVRDYDWVSRRSGFALVDGGRLYATRDGGRRWSELPAIGGVPPALIAFTSARSGYVTSASAGAFGRGSHLLRTTDGGRTWRPQLVLDAPLRALAAPGGGTDFLLGAAAGVVGAGSGSASLLATTTGGDRGEAARLSLRLRRSGRRRASRRRSRRAVALQLDGRLGPPEGGERILVSMRSARGGRWRRQVVTAASNGAFTTTWKTRGTVLFVAHWAGDDERRGAGSRVLKVTAR